MANITFKKISQGFAFSSDSDSEAHTIRYTNAPLRWEDDPATGIIKFSVGNLGYSQHLFNSSDTITVDGMAVTGNHAAVVLFFESFFKFGSAAPTVVLPISAADITPTGTRQFVSAEQVALWTAGGTAYKGEASPATVPVSGGYYYASVAGTYANFKDAALASIIVTAGDLANNKVRLSVTGTVTTKVLEPSTVVVIADNLTTTDATKALSATQGVVLKGALDGTPAVTVAYPIDFTPLVSTVSAASFSNGSPISVAGKLSSVRIKTAIGSTVTPAAYNVVNTAGTYTYTLLYTFPSWVTVALEETKAFTDSYIIPVGACLFVKTTGIIYSATGNPTGYRINSSGVFSINNAKTSHDFVITTVGAVAGLTTRVTANETALSTVATLPARVTANESALAVIGPKIINQPTTYYNFDVTATGPFVPVLTTAIKGIYVSGNAGAEVYIKTVLRNYLAAARWRIEFCNMAGVTVADYDFTGASPETGDFVLVDVPAKVGFSISAKVLIKWELLPADHYTTMTSPTYKLDANVWNGPLNALKPGAGFSDFTVLSNKVTLNETGLVTANARIDTTNAAITNLAGKYFAFDATANGVYIPVLKPAIKGIYIYGNVASSPEYFIKTVLRNYLAAARWRIEICNAAGTTVCDYDFTGASPETGDFVLMSIPPKFTSGVSSGISAKVLIKWELLSADHYTAMSLPTYKLEPATYLPNSNNILAPTTPQVIDALTTRVTANETAIANGSVDFTWALPDTIYLIVGVEKSIYYDAVISRNDYAPTISALVFCLGTVDRGSNDGRRWFMNPVAGDVGTFDLVFVATSGIKEMGRKTVHVVVLLNTPIAAQKNIVICGDSITEYQNRAKKLKNNFATLGGTMPNFIGRSILPDADVLHEGYAGKTTGYFSASTSPFWNPSKAGGAGLDIANYRTVKGVVGLIDVVELLIGYNDCYIPTQSTVSLEVVTSTSITALNDVIAAFKADNPATKFIINIITLEAVTNTGRPRYYNRSLAIRNVWLLRKALLDTYDLNLVSNVFIADAGICIDRYYGYPSVLQNIGARYVGLGQIPIITDRIHPTSDGTQQLADATFPLLVNLLR